MNVSKILPLSLAAFMSAVTFASAADFNLPMRQTPVPRTTDGVPHIQLGVEPVQDINEELIRRIALLPGVELRSTVISLPGAVGFWLSDEMELARPEAIVGGREFAHIHPDGSFHASLPLDLIPEANNAGWTVSHPWANQRAGWEGFVMIFSAQNEAEVDVVYDLIVASYQHVTGRLVD